VCVWSSRFRETGAAFFSSGQEYFAMLDCLRTTNPVVVITERTWFIWKRLSKFDDQRKFNDDPGEKQTHNASTVGDGAVFFSTAPLNSSPVLHLILQYRPISDTDTTGAFY
jgi:hypothetical protein